jgi:hypothetical protein
MEFANNDTKVGLVLSDMYVGGKMLARVQAERRFSAIQQLQHARGSASKKGNEEEIAKEEEKVEGSSVSLNRRTLLKSQGLKHRRSILTLQVGDKGKEYVAVEKNVLTSSNNEDVDVLRNAAHYSIYAQFVRSFFCLLLCLSKCCL